MNTVEQTRREGTSGRTLVENISGKDKIGKDCVFRVIGLKIIGRKKPTKRKGENMTYYCSIKSHCDSPDWEAETEADSLEEACKKFAKMASGVMVDSDGNEFDSDWSPEDIKPYIFTEGGEKL